jgi:hypothetical protein
VPMGDVRKNTTVPCSIVGGGDFEKTDIKGFLWKPGARAAYLARRGLRRPESIGA